MRSLKGPFRRYGERIRFVCGCVEMNANVKITVNYVRTAFEIYSSRMFTRFHTGEYKLYMIMVLCRLACKRLSIKYLIILLKHHYKLIRQDAKPWKLLVFCNVKWPINLYFARTGGFVCAMRVEGGPEFQSQFHRKGLNSVKGRGLSIGYSAFLPLEMLTG